MYCSVKNMEFLQFFMKALSVMNLHLRNVFMCLMCLGILYFHSILESPSFMTDSFIHQSLVQFHVSIRF